MKTGLLKYTKHIFVYFGASIIPMLLQLAINPLIAMNMSPEDYAITGYYTSFNTLISPLIIFYMLHYYNKRFYEMDEQGRYMLKALIFKSILSFSFLITILCFIALYCYTNWFGGENQFAIMPYLFYTVFAIPLTGLLNLELSDCRMRRNSKRFFSLSVVSGILLLCFNLFFVVIFKGGAKGKVLAPLIANLIMFIFLLYKNRTFLKVSVKWSEFTKLIKFCYPLALGAMLGYFFNGFDKTYLERIGDINEYGYYIVGSSIAAYLGTFAAAVTSTFQPDIYEAISKQNRPMLYRSIFLQLGLIAGVVVVFIIACPLVIKILTASRYMESTIYARIISISTLTSSAYFVLNNYTIAVGRPKLYLYTTIIGSALIALILPIVADKFTYIGGACMVPVSYVMLFLVNLVLLRFKKI